MERQMSARLPRRVQRDLMFRPAQQFLVENLVAGLGESVIRSQSKCLDGLPGDETLYAIGNGAAHVGVRGEGRVVRDQIPDVISKPGHSEVERPAEARLFETNVIADAAFRLQ